MPAIATVLRRRRAILVLAAAAALFITDWPSEVLAGFWREHSMASGIVSGLLFLAVAAVVVEAWFQEADFRRWKRVAGVSYRALAVSLIHLRNELAQLVTGEDSARHGAISDRDRLEAAREILGTTHELEQAETRRQRLSILVENPRWRELVRELSRDLKTRGRETIARWAPLMVVSDRLAADMNQIADLNSQVAHLGQLLWESDHPLSEEGLTEEGEIDVVARRAQMVELWEEIVVRTVEIEEQITWAADVPNWQSLGRRQLTASQLERVTKAADCHWGRRR